MKINSISLKNIRSYKECFIEFSDGITLLSGDIGSGKSSILLALEFALFGLHSSGILSGSSLMRKGCTEASVELDFEVDSKPVKIMRSLKKSSAGAISQKEASLIINNEEMKLSVNELKMKILELLNYPSDFLSKRKISLFRFTVYTPQEEMKKILFEDRNERMDIMRKIFGIEKYQTVRKNLEFYLSKMRAERNFLRGKTDELVKREEELESLKNEIKILESKLSELSEKEKETEKIYYSLKTESAEKEKKHREIIELKLRAELLKKGILSSEKIISETKERIGRIKEEISLEDAVSKELCKKENALAEFPADLNSEISEKEARIGEIKAGIDFENTAKKESDSEEEEIKSLKICPKCKQNVDASHIERIQKECSRKISESESKVKNLSIELEEIKKSLEILKKKKSEHNELIIGIEKIKSSLELIKEKKSMLYALEKEIKSRIDESEKFSAELEDAEKKIREFSSFEENYSEFKKRFSDVEEKLRKESDEKLRTEAILSEKNSQEKNLSAHINSLKDSQKKIARISAFLGWCDKKFFSLLNLVERTVMVRIHREFEQIFSEWMGVLVDEETIIADVDSDFSPKIRQNGYDVEVEHLSGGEKTAVALAYRLALNKIVNDISGDIKTKDFLILDEPTDGFSSEQVDKLNEVLSNLGMSQLLIVSHENKIEGSADNIIRIVKRGHVSELG